MLRELQLVAAIDLDIDWVSISNSITEYVNLIRQRKSDRSILIKQRIDDDKTSLEVFFSVFFGAFTKG
jgi:hypothetical protein